MNKNTIIGLVLIFGLIVAFSWWNAPSREEREKAKQEQAERQRVQDSITNENLPVVNEQVVENSGKDVVIHTSTDKVVLDESNPFAHSYQGEISIFEIQTDLTKIKIQNLGGNIAEINLLKYLTWKKDSLIIFDETLQDFYLQFYANKRLITTKDLYFADISYQNFGGEMNEHSAKISGNDSLVAAMRLYPDVSTDKSQYIEFVYTFHGNDYMIGFDVNIVGMGNIIETTTDFIDMKWHSDLRRNEKAPNLEDPNSVVYYKPANDDVDCLSAAKDDEEHFTTPLKWIAFKQQFFSSVLIMDSVPMNNADLKNYTDKSKNKENYVKTMDALIGLPYKANADNHVDMSLYVGPNKYTILRSYDLDLERMIPLGWGFFLLQWINRFAVIPVFGWLESTGMSYGLIILILTILLKIVLSPITFKSYMSTAKTRVLKPEVDEISAKFPKQEQAMEKQKAVMALYKKAGINQLAGCIPMLIQFPFLIAFFRFFPAAIELRQESFLWADDLSSYDSILNLGFNIPFYGDHISLFALMMAVTNLLFTMTTMKQSAGQTQMPGMKIMMYAMPIMFLGFLNSYSAALNYYYTISTLMTFFITWIIKISIDENKIRQKIAEHKAKPQKKSKWMARLEEMQRQQAKRK